MKASFFKRISAYIIDYIIIMLALVAITASMNINNVVNDKINDLTYQYRSGDITIDEYSEKIIPLNYELSKRKLPANIATVVVFIGYYVVFAYFNKGQTFGKKICKIKVVNNDGDKPSIWNMLVRSLFIYGIITSLYSIITINFLSMNDFSYSVSVISIIECMFIVITVLMMLYKKDGRGLHDIIAKTNVIGEER
mgnify:FL=1